MPSSPRGRFPSWIQLCGQLGRYRRGKRGAQGEVLAGLQQKLKYSDRERTFCCLVAESAEQPGALAGVVEVSLQGEPVRAPCSALARAGSRCSAVASAPVSLQGAPARAPDLAPVRDDKLQPGFVLVREEQLQQVDAAALGRRPRRAGWRVCHLCPPIGTLLWGHEADNRDVKRGRGQAGAGRF